MHFMGRKENIAIKFYADRNVPSPVIDQLRKIGLSVLSVSDSDDSLNERQLLEKAKQQKAILLTCNINYLNIETILFKALEGGTCIVVLRMDQYNDMTNYGSILLNLIEQIGVLRRSKGLRNLKITLGQEAVWFHFNHHDIEKIEKYAIQWSEEGKCTFTKEREDYNLKQLRQRLNEATPRRMRRDDNVERRYISFQHLDELIPENHAEMLGEIIAELFEQNILVFGMKSEVLNGIRNIIIKYDNVEIFPHDSEIKKIIDTVLKRQQQQSESGFFVSETIFVPDMSLKAEAKPLITEVVIPLPTIPQLSAVTPTLATDDAPLLTLKPKKNKMRPASDSIAEDDEEDVDDVQVNPIEALLKIPKVYDRAKLDKYRRLSSFANITGMRGEEIVVKYLSDRLIPTERRRIRWVSVLGEKPGWDIEYVDSHNRLIAIEVKGTTGKSFLNIEITGNEWEAANHLRDRYWIYLVSDCCSKSPRIQRIQNPFDLKESGKLQVTPMLWRVEFIADHE